jgi:hypothetical protein
VIFKNLIVTVSFLLAYMSLIMTVSFLVVGLNFIMNIFILLLAMNLTDSILSCDSYEVDSDPIFFVVVINSIITVSSLW